MSASRWARFEASEGPRDELPVGERVELAELSALHPPVERGPEVVLDLVAQALENPAHEEGRERGDARHHQQSHDEPLERDRLGDEAVVDHRLVSPVCSARPRRSPRKAPE